MEIVAKIGLMFCFHYLILYIDWTIEQWTCIWMLLHFVKPNSLVVHESTYIIIYSKMIDGYWSW